MVGVGARPGQYELLAELGHGGMATLWLAKRAGAAGFERLAAVKVVHPHLAKNERFTLMLVDEAKVSSRVHHPNVVRVEDFGEHEGSYFLAMEYVHGCSLAGLMRRLSTRGEAPLPAVAVKIAMEVADGLHAAHGARDEQGRLLNIVHRDVSPQNILLSYGGHVKLIDFGIAKARFRAQETKSVRIKGKLGYMSPEQVTRKPLGPHTDIYALGIVLWEMLTMRRYFYAENELAMLDLIRAPVPKPVAPYADIPSELEQVVRRALEPEPVDRFSSAREFRKALARACPDAVSLDATDLAELLDEMMRGEREQLDEKLPESVVRELRAEEHSGMRRTRSRSLSIDIGGASWVDETLDESDDAAPAPALDVARDAEAPQATPAPAAEPRRRLGKPAAAVIALIAVAAGASTAVLTLDDEADSDGEQDIVVMLPPPRPEPPPPTPDDPVIELTAPDPPPAPVLSITERARTCAEDGDHACVVELLDELDDPSATQLSLLADAFLGVGSRGRARRAARRYVRSFPNGPDAERLRELLQPPAGRRGSRGRGTQDPDPPPATDLPFSTSL